MVSRVATVIGLLCILATACEGTATATQVTVVLDADSAVSARIATLELNVEGGVEPMLARRFDTVITGPALPLRIALVPAGGDASRLFRVSAVARSAMGDVVGTVRLRDGYVRGRHLERRLRFEACCEPVAPMCAADETCRGCACVAEDAPDDAGAPIDGGTPSDAGPPLVGPCEEYPRRGVAGVDVIGGIFDVIGNGSDFTVAFRGSEGLSLQRLTREGAPVGTLEVLGELVFSLDALDSSTGPVLAAGIGGIVAYREVDESLTRVVVSTERNAHSPRLAEGAAADVLVVFPGSGGPPPDLRAAVLSPDGRVREGPRIIAPEATNHHVAWTGDGYLVLYQQGTVVNRVLLDRDGNVSSGPAIVGLGSPGVPFGAVRNGDAVLLVAGFGSETQLIELELDGSVRTERTISHPAGWRRMSGGSELVASDRVALHARWSLVGVDMGAAEDHLFVELAADTNTMGSALATSGSLGRRVDVAYADGQFVTASTESAVGEMSPLVLRGVCPP